MGKVYAGLDDRLREFIARQPVFFVATAPSGGGHVNVSPKGYRDTLAILGPTTVAYLDLTGSGAETIAHLRQTGRVVLPADPEWGALAARFPAADGAGTARGNHRAIIVAEISRIADSCGYAVPVMDLVAERDLLTRWSERRSAEQLVAYRAEHNAVSIDGLPALD